MQKTLIDDSRFDITWKSLQCDCSVEVNFSVHFYVFIGPGSLSSLLNAWLAFVSLFTISLVGLMADLKKQKTKEKKH